MREMILIPKEEQEMYDDYENMRRYDDVLTVNDLMDYLAIGKNTAYRLLRAKKIKAIKIGRIYKIPKANVQKFVQAANGGKNIDF